MQQCAAELRDRLPPCSDDDTQLATQQVLNNLCCGRLKVCVCEKERESRLARELLVPAVLPPWSLGTSKRGAEAPHTSPPRLEVSGTLGDLS